jgi:hypothetical protein
MVWKARGRPASRRTSSTVDVLAPRHPLQWDGGDGGTMAKDNTASKRSAEVARAHARYSDKDFRVWGDKDFRAIAWPKSRPRPIECPLDDEGTRRILDEVGGRFVPRRGLKLEALRNDLYGCYVDWCSLTQLSSDKIARQRVQRLKTIAKRADAVLALLNEEGVIGDWARQEIAMTFPLKKGVVRKTVAFRTDHGQPDAAPSFNGFLAGLQRLAAAARYKAEYFPDRAPYLLPRSPFEFFVANVLSSVYERHFKRAAGFSVTETGGPYIRFAVEALRALGITNKGKPYARDTIARALSGARAGRVGRRKKD